MIIEASMKALRLRQGYALAHNNICAANIELERYGAAIEACEKALSIDSGFNRAKNNLSQARNRLAESR